MPNRAEVRKCRRCGRLFSGTADQLRCSQCSQLNLDAARQVDDAVDRLGLRTIDEIVEATGLTPAEVLTIVRETSALREMVDTGQVCERCRKAPAQNGARFCAECRLTLTRAFEQASVRLMEQLAARAAEREDYGTAAVLRMSVNQALRQKRRLTRSTRLDPTPHNRWSG